MDSGKKVVVGRRNPGRLLSLATAITFFWVLQEFLAVGGQDFPLILSVRSVPAGTPLLSPRIR